MNQSNDTIKNRNANYWAEDPRVPLCDWRYEVANGDTRLGYWEFVAARMDESYPEDSQ